MEGELMHSSNSMSLESSLLMKFTATGLLEMLMLVLVVTVCNISIKTVNLLS
jgi:hypothetical protein